MLEDLNLDWMPVKNFARVTDSVYRGAPLDAQGLEFLHDFGVKTVIDLRYPGEAPDLEYNQAFDRGLAYFNISMSYFGSTDLLVEQFLHLIAKPEYQPVFVHCTNNGIRTNTLLKRALVEADRRQILAA